MTLGDKVYRFAPYDFLGRFYVQALVIESWDRFYGTARDLTTGDVLIDHFYSISDKPQFMLIDDCPDPIAEGTQRAAAFLARLQVLVCYEPDSLALVKTLKPSCEWLHKLQHTAL